MKSITALCPLPGAYRPGVSRSTGEKVLILIPAPSRLRSGCFLPHHVPRGTLLPLGASQHAAEIVVTERGGRICVELLINLPVVFAP